jgi:hypothetical protein
MGVGTLCVLDGFLAAFVHWQALMMETLDHDGDSRPDVCGHDAYGRTLTLDEADKKWKTSGEWSHVCYHVFTSLIRDRLPHMPLHGELQPYVEARTDMSPGMRRRVLQEICGRVMIGRCFCPTETGLLGMVPDYGDR